MKTDTNELAINLPCGSTRLNSSRRLAWSGILIERHVAHIQPAEQSYFPTLLIELASGTSIACGERQVGRGQFRRYEKRPGAINVYTEGVRPALRPITTTELTVCAIDRLFLEECRPEVRFGMPSEPRQVFGLRDPALAGILSLLEAEAIERNPSGKLYADHLVQALILRLYTARSGADAIPARRWDFPRRSLQRTIDRMRADLAANHDLETLARESGYSRNHFIQIFRSATGITPHQYLLRLRLERAQDLLANTSQSVTEIATSCGFQQQSHFSKVFRNVLGTAPLAYRKHLSF